MLEELKKTLVDTIVNVLAKNKVYPTDTRESIALEIVNSMETVFTERDAKVTLPSRGITFMGKDGKLHRY